MPRTVGIGHQNFEKLITKDYFYIDKTKFIKEWWESGDEVTLITRPRRFGKTLTLSMVTTTSEKYEDSFGFTQEEVWDILKEYGLYEQRERVRYWYDGFTFGKKPDIYNPWSIINYLDKRRFSPY